MTLLTALNAVSFREKTAWAMASILTLAGIHYYNKVVSISAAQGETAAPLMGLVVAYVVFVVVTSIIVMSILSATSGREADAPADEREKMIARQGGELVRLCLCSAGAGSAVVLFGKRRW